MRSTIAIGGKLAVLSLLIVLIFWYHDLLAGQFDAIQRLLPTHG